MRTRSLGVLLLAAVLLFLLPLETSTSSRSSSDSADSARLADFPSSSSSSSAPQASVALASVARHALALFEKLDTNGDGMLDDDEMTLTLRRQLPKWDTNHDGVIDANEFLAYFSARVQQQQQVQDEPDAVFIETTSSAPSKVRTTASKKAGGLEDDAVQTALRNDPAFDQDGPLLAEWLRAGLPVGEVWKLGPIADRFLLPAAWFEQDERTSSAQAAGDGQAPGASAGGVPNQQPASRSNREALEAQYLSAAAAALRSPAGPAGLPRFAAPRSLTNAPSPLRSAPPPSSTHANGSSQANPSSPLSPAVDTQAFVDSLATMPMPLDDGSNVYWVERNAVNVEAVQSGQANVVFLGDSITDWLATGDGAVWWDQFYAPLNALNMAVGGTTTSEVLWQIETGQVASASPDVVVLMIGTNNLSNGQSPGAVAEGISAIVTNLQEQVPSTRILLLGVLPRGESPDDPYRTQIAEVNTLLAELADGDKVRFLDIGSSFLKPNGSISPRIMSDFVHPTMSGYLLYAGLIWEPVLDMLNDAKAASKASPQQASEERSMDSMDK
jgi:lysophospholipase L1-like esterase